MEKNNPYIEHKIESKKAKDSHGRSILMFVIVVLLVLTSFIVGIFLGNTRSNTVIDEKDAEITTLKDDLDQANKQIDSFGEDQQQEDEPSTNISQDIIDNLAAALNSENTQAIDSFVGGSVLYKFNKGPEQSFVGTQLSESVFEMLANSGGNWTQVVDSDFIDNYKDGDNDAYLTKEIAAFESQNDYFIAFTLETGVVTRAILITEDF